MKSLLYVNILIRLHRLVVEWREEKWISLTWKRRRKLWGRRFGRLSTAPTYIHDVCRVKEVGECITMYITWDVICWVTVCNDMGNSQWMTCLSWIRTFQEFEVSNLPGREFPIAVPPERSFFILWGSCSSLGGSKTQFVAAMVSTSWHSLSLCSRKL